MAKKNLNEMSFLDHLEELRWLLVRSTIAVVVMGIVTYFVSDYLFDSVLLGPTRPTFFTYQYFCQLSHQLGFAESICITELNFIIQNTEMEGQVNIFVWMCLLAGFVLSFPYILWELWKFISPALYEKERKNAKVFIFTSSLLFFLGVLFGYYVVIPMSVNFVATFSVSDVVKNQFTLDSYMGMVKTSILASGLFFELPILIYFLTKLGLVTPDFLRKYWKYAVIIILIVAAIVTPPDVVSQTIVAIPMLLIYEVSILISRIVYRNKMKENV
ncbi:MULTISPECIES: twin-arginine translocase subunit TatC [Flavobacterium]|jgi:sec-independent protein translocase protein TatC|uniref:Sec-independent protein translocase protein TatC n=1 Tax=Flavobacterium cupriresistens TaxID=2893885 RepID=A0ABU4RBW0_9FLAO|nr:MULTISPECIES: twin-arginine translocase subunit TatC [unclassified Flavobacterium]KLT71022.1 preprotein translocase subunit TatC [Flavobacterium sp. ABG]MDX6190067.1 twin-arginine translocase subunit TatC [Flavobacterium sp. Fl-318]UFH42891.1 twin-arginine translocase subunit TatC [Flavobacterium sp. F-323]